MKKIITLLSVLLPLCTCAQVSFSFESGTAEGWIFSAPDRWAADNVSPLNGKYSLHHVFDNTVAGEEAALFSIEGLCPDCSDVVWEFTVRHGAEPSSSNKWVFILASDIGFEGIVGGTAFSGFVAGVNFSGYDDTLRLWQVTEGKAEPVITSGVNWQNDVGIEAVAKIRVTRTATGVWGMEVESGSKGHGAWSMEQGVQSMEQKVWSEVQGARSMEQVAKEKSVEIRKDEIANRTLQLANSLPELANHKSKLTNSPPWRWAGISYTYTSTRDRLLWVDDVAVTGVFVEDLLPPAIVSVTAVAPDILRVQFDEEPDPSSLTISNLSLTGGAVISAVTKIGPEVYELFLSTETANRINTRITFGKLCDDRGNCSSQAVKDFVPVYAVTGDVVITEIMADPSPPVQLPDVEFLELANLTTDSLSLRGWIMIADSDTSGFPDIRIRAGERLVICSSSKTSVFSGNGRVTGLTGFPSLSDAGETLALRDSRGGLIHAVTYSKSCYKDEWRSGGGWSMELTDTENPFNAPDAWRASTDPSGGTPGSPNSRIVKAPDSRCPEIIAVYPVSPMQVRIVFDETVTGVLAADDWITDGLTAVSSASDDIADRAFVIMLQETLVTDRIYTVLIPGSAADFSGNAPCHPEAEFGIPEQPLAGDILFNEILFDPLPVCADYLELYNSSEKVIDLSQVYLAGSDPGGKGSDAWGAGSDQGGKGSDAWGAGFDPWVNVSDTWGAGFDPVEKSSGSSGRAQNSGKSASAAIAISQVPRQLLPGALVALTTDRNAVTGHYPCSDKRNVYEVRALPSMPDDKGTVIILDRALCTLDRLDYSSSMHLDLLDIIEGIALEKVGTELSSGFAANWHSATEVCGWGTPGAPNSVLVNEAPEGQGLNLSSERVSPDGDGFEDAVSVRVVPGGSDNIVTVTVFNARGYPVKRLAERLVAGEEALIIWDGTGDGGGRLSAGLYLIIAESFDSHGRTWRGKKVCALLYR